MSHVVDLIPEWSLGALAASEAAEVAAHVATCASCAAESVRAREMIETLGLLPEPVPVGAHVRARLLASTRDEGRLARLTGTLARFLDVTREKSRALLEAIDVAAAWEPGPLPSIALIHVTGGPRVAAADCGLLRLPAGLEWPLHRHVGDEAMLILEGAIAEVGGATYTAGAVLAKAAGTEHAFRALPDGDCVCAVVVFEGIEMPPGTPLDLG